MLLFRIDFFVSRSWLCLRSMCFVHCRYELKGAYSTTSSTSSLSICCIFVHQVVFPIKSCGVKHLLFCFGTQSRSTPTSGPPKVSARAPAHRSYHFRGVKLKSCIKKIHHNLYISKQANVRIKHADTEGASHKKFGTDARVQ